MNSKKKQAFNRAHGIRKFEIELYWKRATYFWAFIATAFAGYFAVLNSNNIAFKEQYLFLIESFGFIFSLGWYFVNRGSKHWQLNWEKIIDFLEDDITGPLMKSSIVNNNSFLCFLSSYRFSVSRINQVISLFVTCVWFLLMVLTTISIFSDCTNPNFGSWLYSITLIMTIFFVCLLCRCGKHLKHENIEFDGSVFRE